MRLGTVLENAGKIEQAINLYYQVTVMRKAVRGDRDPSVGDGLVCMARALRVAHKNQYAKFCALVRSQCQ